MARPREFDEQAVLEAAEDAFRTRGYAGTSLQDLMAATRLGKGSLYAAFGDKHDLYLRVLDGYVDRNVGAVGDALAGAPAIAALHAHLRGAARGATSGPSCLLMSSTAELAAVDEDVRQRVRSAVGDLQARYVAAVVRAQEEGDVDPDADPKALGTLLLSVARGLEALGKAGQSRASLLGAADAAIAGLPRPRGG